MRSKREFFDRFKSVMDIIKKRGNDDIDIDIDYDFELPDAFAEDVLEEYYVEKPFAKVSIVQEGDRIYYKLHEPDLPISSEEFENVIQNVFIGVMDKKYDRVGERELLEVFLEYAKAKKYDRSIATAIWYHLRNRSIRGGKITALIFDENVEDISCSGAEMPVYVFHRKYGYIPTNVTFTKEELESFVRVVAQKTGHTLSYDNPIVDTVMYDGSRINIVYGNVISRDTSFSVRKSKTNPFTPAELIAWNSFSPEMFALLWLAVDSRCSIMFIGGTGSGKTTSLNATALFIPLDSKIVSIEDTWEIMLPHENWVSLITNENMTQFDLLKAALRQRPEFVIVGEARGVEAREMFQAMGIGHTVLTTMHGGSVQEIFRRLVSEPYNVKKDQLMLLDFVVTVADVSTKVIPERKCISVDMVTVNSLDVGERVLQNIYVNRIAGYDKGKFSAMPEPALERFAEKTHKPYDEIYEEYVYRLSVLKELANVKLNSAAEFVSAIDRALLEVKR